MKMYRFMLLYVVAGLLSVSCNDWLDVQPETEQKEEEQFSDYKGFCGALTGCYMAMGHTDIYGERLTMSNIESLASLWYIPNEPSSSSARAADYYLKQRDYNDVARKALQAIYSKLFNVIVQTNKIIKNAESNADVFPDEATRSVILGEAYAMRAYCQLDVLRLFGEVPNGDGEKVSLPYSEITAFNERPERYDFAGYSEKLLADLDKAEKLLKDNDPIFSYTFGQLNQPLGIELEDAYMCYRQSRLNYWAVKALQARAYLYLGNSGQAYAAAKAVIDGKDGNGESVMILSGNTDRSNGYKACPNECLFYLSKNDVKAVARILIGGAAIQTGANYLYITTERLNELFPQNKDADNRYGAMWNKQAQSSTAGRFNATMLKYYFDDAAENQTLYYQIIPMLRMSEMYLIAIETTPDATEANTLYADYMRMGCGVVLGSDTFEPQTNRVQVLLPEYRREFYAEGQMFYAYKRNKVKTILWHDNEMADKDYVMWNCVNTEFNP